MHAQHTYVYVCAGRVLLSVCIYVYMRCMCMSACILCVQQSIAFFTKCAVTDYAVRSSMAIRASNEEEQITPTLDPDLKPSVIRRVVSDSMTIRTPTRRRTISYKFDTT